MQDTIGVQRPPFGVGLVAPDGWQVLRSAAPTLRDDLLALVARSPAWAALDERRRRGSAVLLGAVAELSAASGALATLLGTDLPGVAVVTLAWRRTAPLRADLDLARLVAGVDRDAPLVETGTGPGVLVRAQRPGPAGGPWSTSQLLVPVPGSVWLATLTATALSEQAARAADEALLDVAGSLRVQRRAA